MFPDGEKHNQIVHVLIDKRQHSRVVDIQCSRGADCDTDHYLMVAKVREKLSVSKRTAQNFGMERFNLKILNDVEVKEHCPVKISNRFAAVAHLDVDMDITRVWEK
jgi:hypothetical protein